MKYLLDSNCFITPSRGYCPIDVGLSFWTKLKELAERDIIYTLDNVKDEIYVNDDALSQWMKDNMPKTFFIKFEGEKQIKKFTLITNEINDSTFYTNKAKEDFLRMDKADIFLTAFANVEPSEWTVVSMERSSQNSTSQIKLPDICHKYGVSCIQPEDMFRALRETF